MDFLGCGTLAGTYLYGLLQPYFGPPTTVFGFLGFTVIFVGFLMGGVIGVLVPKSTAAISLGVYVALFLCMVR